MKINKEEIMKVVDNPKTICWSDVLIGLDLVPVFEEYKKANDKCYYIGKIKLGKTLMNKVDTILKKRIKKSKDKRVCAYKVDYRETIYAMDSLNSQPAEAKEDIDYMELEGL